MKLDWIIAPDSSIKEFAIERMTKDGRWEAIGRVRYNGVNQNDPSYSYTDENPHQGISYYRINVLEDDGTSLYSEVKSINNKSHETISIFPNPILQAQNLSVINSSPRDQSLAITNRLGQMVLTRTLLPGKNMIAIEQLDVGYYMCLIEDGNLTETHKLFIIK